MNWSKYLMAAVGGSIALAVIGAVWHALVPSGFSMTVLQGILPTIVVMDFVRGFALAYVYPVGYKGGPALVEGLRMGAVLGILLASPAWILLAATNQPMGLIVSESIFLIVQNGIGGAVIGLIWGKAAA
jgi:hypothetical protein